MLSLKQLIAASAAQAGTPEIVPIMEAIHGQESGSSGSSDIVNKDSGARGPFQVMPATARMYGFKGSDKELQDPETNARYSALKIADDYKKYKGNADDVIAAYYQGDNRKVKFGNGYVAQARDGYPSTDDYVKQVKGRMGGSMADAMQQAVTTSAPADATGVSPQQGGEQDIAKLMEWLKTQQSQPQIEELYQKHISQNETQQEPADRPVPNAPSLGTRLLSGFSGGLASNITRNPDYLQNATAGLNDVQGKHDSATEANVLKHETFLTEKQKRTRALQDKLHEFHLGQLLDAGDTEKALKLMNTKASMEARYKKEAEDHTAGIKNEQQKQKLQDWLTRDSNREEERRKTMREKVASVASQTKMPEAAKVALQESLDSIQSEYKSRRDQMAVMQGGEGFTDETFHAMNDEEQAKIQQIIDAYMKKYAPTNAEGKVQPTIPVMAPHNDTPFVPAAVDSTTPNVPAAAPTHVETPQERIIRLARAFHSQKGK